MATIHVSGGGGALNTAANSCASGDTLVIDDSLTYDHVIVTAASKSVHYRAADGETPVIDGEGSYRCITQYQNNYWTASGSVTGVALKNGYCVSSDGQHQVDRGGGGTFGIQNFTNCSFIDCYAGVGAGGIFTNTGECKVSRCSFLRCTAGGHGGAIGGGGPSEISDCTFTECGTTPGSGNAWGGAFISSKNPSIKCCQFVRCFARNGGVVHGNTNSGSRYLERCVFEDCESSGYTLTTCEARSCLFLRCKASQSITRESRLFNCTFDGTDSPMCAANDRTFIQAQYVIANSVLDGGVRISNAGYGDTAKLANNVLTSTPSISSGVSVEQSNNTIVANASALLLDSNGRPKIFPRSPVWNAGSAALLASTKDIDGVAWKDTPSAGCYQFLSAPTIPTRLSPFGVQN